MATIKDYFEQAQLAQAAYANLAGVVGQVPLVRLTPNDPQTFAPNFSVKQAEEFQSHYLVINHLPSDTFTGFSATLFQNIDTGEYTLAIRGTDQTIDDLLLSDIFGVFGQGIATAQVVDLYNYYQRLITPTGQTVSQWAPINDGGGVYYQNTGSAQGLGKLSASTPLNVTGHSLGGHLAAAFSRLFPNATAAAYEINGLGFYDTSYVNGLFDQLAGQSTAFNNSEISNLYGDAGPEVATNNNLHNQYGTRLPVFIEDQNSAVGNHGKELMVDALAVASVLAMIDPTLNTNPVAGVSKIFAILKASASTDSKSLENTLDGLRTLLEDNYERHTPNGIISDPTGDREDFYTKLFHLNETIKCLPGYDPNAEALVGFSLQSLAGYDGASLAEAAQSDIATRYAVYKLNPFTVSGPGLYEVINTDHALDRYDPATRTGSLSEEYLTDRAEFLGAKISSANQNFEYQDKPWAPYGGAALGPARYFKDNESGYAVFAGLDRNVTGQPLNTLSQYLFGSAKDDPNLTGGDKGDKLYGMDGNDTLQGKKGNDYLEGGRDYDTYIFTTGDGNDTILDTDSQGQILWDGTALQGGAFVAGKSPNDASYGNPFERRAA